MKIYKLSIFVVFGLTIAAIQGLAEVRGGITLEVTSLNNVAGNGAMEACGIARHQDGVKPLLVTIKHDQSFYTTLTAPNDQWCVVVKRWTYSGKIEASATTLSNPGYFSFSTLSLPKEDEVSQ